jgi:hypothetical protein
LYAPGLSKIHGQGLFAAQPIRDGEVVFQWEGLGRIVSDTELRSMLEGAEYWSCVAVGEDQNLVFSVTYPGEEPPTKTGAGGCNHSCDSNLWMQDAFTVCARRDIGAGEELTLDDALIGVDPDCSMESCNCGSPLCRGRVTGNDWRLLEVQQRYSVHFSPFINMRIAKEREAGG